MFYALFKQKKMPHEAAHENEADGVEGDEQVDAAGQQVVAGGQGGADERLSDEPHDLLSQYDAGEARWRSLGCQMTGG